MIQKIISTAVQILIGWLLVNYVPRWVRLKGIIDKIVRVVGVVVIITALMKWI